MMIYIKKNISYYDNYFIPWQLSIILFYDDLHKKTISYHDNYFIPWQLSMILFYDDLHKKNISYHDNYFIPWQLSIILFYDLHKKIIFHIITIILYHDK